MVQGAKAAVTRLQGHPIVAAKDRALELFGTCKVDALTRGEDAFQRPKKKVHRRELSLFLPGTYQSEGGASHPLSNDLVIPVLRHIVLAYTGNEGRPSETTGYTLIPGAGFWFSQNAMTYVEEPIQIAVIHLENVDLPRVRSLIRYLRFAWLQDMVFATLDGQAVSLLTKPAS